MKIYQLSVNGRVDGLNSTDQKAVLSQLRDLRNKLGDEYANCLFHVEAFGGLRCERPGNCERRTKSGDSALVDCEIENCDIHIVASGGEAPVRPPEFLIEIYPTTSSAMKRICRAGLDGQLLDLIFNCGDHLLLHVMKAELQQMKNEVN